MLGNIVKPFMTSCMILSPPFLNTPPVGVLRGQKSRFQLFGDTVNTCARLESSGEGNAIHISKETANLLIDAGKPFWIREREDAVELKGKGTLKTFWVVTNLSPSTPAGDSGAEGNSKDGKPSSSIEKDDMISKTSRAFRRTESLIAVLPVPAHEQRARVKVSRGA